MKIIQPSFKLRFPTKKETIKEMLMLVEEAARLCYQSEGLQEEEFNAAYIRSKIDVGHESVIEHSMITLRVVCDRGITHEIVRHRLASYSQESTRFCNYSKGKFGSEITVIDLRKGIELDVKMRDVPPENVELIMLEWLDANSDAERHYMRMTELGASPQIARSVLNNSTKTEIIMTMNFREWRHFFKMRWPIAAHPQMRELTRPMLKEFKRVFPVIFDDLHVQEDA